MKSRDLGRVFSPLGTSVQHGDGVWREGSVGFCPALMCDALSEYAEVRGCVEASRPHGPQERGSAPPPSRGARMARAACHSASVNFI